jgi:nucleoside-diphosphate-sugar epimerase
VKVFIAGARGVLGRGLVARLAARGGEVTGLLLTASLLRRDVEARRLPQRGYPSRSRPAG